MNKQMMQCSMALVLAVSALGVRAQAAAKDDLFAGTEMFAKGASNVTEITMDPESLKQVDGKDAPSARRTVLSVVRTYTYDKPGMFRMEDVDTFRARLAGADWHCSVHVRDLKSGDSTDVCTKHRTDGLRESAVMTVSPKSLTFIHSIKRPATADEKSEAWRISNDGTVATLHVHDNDSGTVIVNALPEKSQTVKP